MSTHQLHLSARKAMIIRSSLEVSLSDTRSARRRLRLRGDDRETALVLERELVEIIAFLPVPQ